MMENSSLDRLLQKVSLNPDRPRHVYRDLVARGVQVYNIAVVEKHKIAYIVTPKCACTSLKHVMYKLKNNVKFQPDPQNGKYIHQEMRGLYIDLSQFKDYFRFAIIRDPIKRLLSCYSNRVIHYQDLKKVSSQLKEFNLKVQPGLNYFCENLEKYFTHSPSIKHHANFQGHFLPSLDELSATYKIEELDLLREKLSKITNTKILIPYYKSEGKKFRVTDLKPSSLEKLIEFYREDYEFLKDYYSIDSIWQEFSQ